MKKQLIELLNIYGTSGNEKPVRDYLEPILEEIMDFVHVDKYGNLLGEMKVGSGKGATILLSAHMDTVRGVRPDKIVKEKDGVIFAVLPDGKRGVLGADDRAGIAIILSVLRNIPKSFNGTIKVAFSREEEIGCVGSGKIPKGWYSDVDLAIVVDRKGSRDIVVGCVNAFCSNPVGIFMEEVSAIADMDWKCVEGGVSDAFTFSENGINSINLSAGYTNEHTEQEFVVLSLMRDTVKLIVQTLALVNNFKHTFGEVPEQNKWVRSYGKYKDYGVTYDADYEYVDEDVWIEEHDEEYGNVCAYGAGRDVIINQGSNEIIMSARNFKKLVEKLYQEI